MSIEAMKQALEALDGLSEPYNVLKAQDALRQAIEAAEKQEPYGYFRYDIRLDAWVQSRDSNKGVAFYTHPPKREWVGLTDENVRELWSWSASAEAERTANTQQHAFARALEAKLREKNG